MFLTYVLAMANMKATAMELSLESCLGYLFTIVSQESYALAQEWANYGLPTLVETSIHLLWYGRGDHTNYTKEPKTIEAIIEKATAQSILNLN